MFEVTIIVTTMMPAVCRRVTMDVGGYLLINWPPVEWIQRTNDHKTRYREQQLTYNAVLCVYPNAIRVFPVAARGRAASLTHWLPYTRSLAHTWLLAVSGLLIPCVTEAPEPRAPPPPRTLPHACLHSRTRALHNPFIFALYVMCVCTSHV